MHPLTTARAGRIIVATAARNLGAERGRTLKRISPTGSLWPQSGTGNLWVGGVIAKPSENRRERQRSNRRFKLISELHPNQELHIHRVVEFSAEGEVQLDAGAQALSRAVARHYFRLWMFSEPFSTRQQADDRTRIGAPVVQDQYRQIFR